MSPPPPRPEGNKPTHPPVVGRSKSTLPPNGSSKQAQLQAQTQGQGQPRRSHDHTLGIEIGDGDLRRSSSVNLTSSNGNGRPAEAQTSTTITTGRSSSGVQSASQASYPTGSPQIASSPGAQVRHKSPFVAGHSAPPTPTMSPPARVGKDPRSPGVASPTEVPGPMWKPVEVNGTNHHGANHALQAQSLAVTSPIATGQPFAPGSVPTPTNGRPSTPSFSGSSMSTTYQITPTGYVIFGGDARSQQVRRDMEDLLPILLPGLTLPLAPAELAEAEAQLVRLAESLALALQKRFFLLQVARGDYAEFPPRFGYLPLFNEEVLRRAHEAEHRARAAGVALAREHRERQRMRRGTQILEDVDAHMTNGDHNHNHTNGNYGPGNTAGAAAAAAAAAGASSPMSQPAFYPTASGGEATFRRM